MIEIELKVAVPALDPVREALMRLGAKPAGSAREHDVYYNAPHRDFAKTDEAVRVRYTDDHAVVTYKGAKIKSSGLKAREELNTAVESGPVFEAILDRLGFTRTAEVNKQRENFQYAGASISLDLVEELGTFVEIEVMAEDGNPETAPRIEKIADAIGVHGRPILMSYLELVMEKRGPGKNS
ncbi:MAG TPA: class IV adenylate cyclase [Methanoregula sp.]|nr:class IV adenylate cyclase [Methanoregula sp.]